MIFDTSLYTWLRARDAHLVQKSLGDAVPDSESGTANSQSQKEVKTVGESRKRRSIHYVSAMLYFRKLNQTNWLATQDESSKQE